VENVINDALVTHQTINGKYKIQYERAATKGVIGFKVEANGDDLKQVQMDALALKLNVESAAVDNTTPVAESVKEK